MQFYFSPNSSSPCFLISSWDSCLAEFSPLFALDGDHNSATIRANQDVSTPTKASFPSSWRLVPEGARSRDAVTRGGARSRFTLAAALVNARGEGVEVKGGWVWEREGEGGGKRKGTYRKGKGPHIHVTVAAEGK